MSMVMKKIIWFMTNDYGHEEYYLVHDQWLWSWTKLCTSWPFIMVMKHQVLLWCSDSRTPFTGSWPWVMVMNRIVCYWFMFMTSSQTEIRAPHTCFSQGGKILLLPLRKGSQDGIVKGSQYSPLWTSCASLSPIQHISFGHRHCKWLQLSLVSLLGFLHLPWYNLI